MLAGLADPVVNLTLMFTELPLLQRPAAAKQAGFERVELWWPFGSCSRPTHSQVQAFIHAVKTAEVELVHMNLFTGDTVAGERGIASHPERVSEFRDSLTAAITIGSQLGTKLFNVHYGHCLPGVDPGLIADTGAANLRFAADTVAEIGGTILIEALSGWPLYPITTTTQAVKVINRMRSAGVSNIAYLLDQYHLVTNGEDVFDSVTRYASYVAHVQIADSPGRHEPGTGCFDFSRWLPLQLSPGAWCMDRPR